MTLGNEQKRTRRLRAPQENRAVVIDPAWNKVTALIQKNISLRTQADYDFQGRSLAEIMRQARRELLDAARAWTAAYRDVGPAADDPLAPIFLAGHQPQMFHPGVWLKNFALGRLAKQHQATAINLIIDSDVISDTWLRVPAGSTADPYVVQAAFDRPNPKIPYEERRIEDRELFHGFGAQVREIIASLIPHPLVEKYWPIVIDQSQETDRLGACLARARHILEAQWGSTTLEIPQSRVCGLNSFHWLVAHILAKLPIFSSIYNEAVREHRRLQRIRNASHPVPDLAVEDQWLEAPFWIWTEENPRRKRLFVKHCPSELILSDRQDIEARLPLTDQSDAARAVQQLVELERRNVKIRSRALVTTLWARLVLSDLFVHGIGGGNYDRLTDRIIERFFQRKPQGFMILSATLHLPINKPPLRSPRSGRGEGLIKKSPLPLGEGQGEGIPTSKRDVGSQENLSAIDRQLRELTYHPEQYLDGIFDKALGIPGELHQLIDSKRQWIETPQTMENARTRCQAIRRINESLQPWLAEERRRLLNRRAEAARQYQAEKILTWREYGFCLYPEETMRDFLDTLLPR